jgi:hypothetical protein
MTVKRRVLNLFPLLFELKELVDLLREFEQFVTVLLARSFLAERNNLS